MTNWEYEQIKQHLLSAINLASTNAQQQQRSVSIMGTQERSGAAPKEVLTTMACRLINVLNGDQ